MTAVTDEQTSHSDWQRRARIAKIFGEVLPESTSDDRESEAPTGSQDQWLKDQVPPHHG
ncbi:MAG: hypothetical protein ACSLEW_12810 [Nocardioides sp.]